MYINNKWLAVYLSLLFLSFTAFARPDFFDEREVARQQSEMLEQNRQQREALENSAALPITISPQAPVTSDVCFPIHDIQVIGADYLPRRAREQLIHPYLNRCLGLEQIQRLVQQISDWYLNRGYVTSRAFLTGQDLTGGVLRITVLEGRLQEVRLGNQLSSMLVSAFPGRKDKILNLRDIEQGMENINRLRRQPVSIDILPGTRPGYSVVNLRAAEEFPFQLELAVDNSGQKSTGSEQINGLLIGNNLVGIADRWTLSGGRSSDFSTARDAQIVQASLSLPYGYWLADYGYTWSSYLATYRQPYEWRYEGANETHRLNFSRVLYRDDRLKTSLNFGLTRRSSRNYLNDNQLRSSSRKLTHWSTGINHSQKLWGGYATFNPSFSRGVSWFGAENDRYKWGETPRAEFSKWHFSASYYLPLSREWYWLTSVYGQWSHKQLYGSERLTLGGESSVRGFKEQYISGDNGVYWRNEASRTLLTLPWLGDINAFAALDGGYLRSGPDDSEARGTLVGGALGISGQGRDVNHHVMLGWPLVWPDWMQPDSVAVYYRLSLTL